LSEKIQTIEFFDENPSKKVIEMVENKHERSNIQYEESKMNLEAISRMNEKSGW
jgi:hypothetical protein